MKAPKGLIAWIQTGFSEVATAIDAERNSRLEQHAHRVEAEVQRLKQAFVFAPVIDRLGISRGDQLSVAERVYKRFLARSWDDLSLTTRESDLLAWLAGCLGIPADLRNSLNEDAAVNVFRQVLATSLSDNQVSDTELSHLSKIAATIGQTVPSIMATFLHRDGEAMLRASFARHTADGSLDRQEWDQFVIAVGRLGVSWDSVLRAINQPAKQLVEHALADARSDGEITDSEQHALDWLLATLISDRGFSSYVRQQIADTQFRFNISKGRLPSVSPPDDAALRAGEITHYTGAVRYVRTRELTSGTKVEEYDGHAVITDSRFLLIGATQSFQIAHRKILKHTPVPCGVDIRADGKGTGRYLFPRNHETAVPIWRVAIGRTNQTIVDSASTNTRHIAREIRQRVWQRYGGRCAECGATEYLEFDHIVPVAKGGSNSESNVQLLCRKCNLSKSDRI